MNVRTFIIISLIMVALFPVSAFGSTWTWAKTYGGSSRDSASSCQQTSDGGYIVAGLTYTYATDSDYSDAWIFKLDASGKVIWQKTYGDSPTDRANSIQQTSDGGYIVAGETWSYGSGESDCWVLKLDTNGNVTWQKTYGGSSRDIASSIQQTSDGGYIVAGETLSYDVAEGDCWVLKLDADGNVVWQKTYGGIDNDGGAVIKQTSDGGYIVAATTSSYGGGSYDCWVLKLDADGDVTWQKTYGGIYPDYARSIQETSDGFIMAGETYSYGTDSSYDAWILRLGTSGDVIWQKTYGESEHESADSIQLTSDDGFIVLGTTSSYGNGEDDLWVLKLQADGTVDWQRTYGGSDDEMANSIKQVSDGGYIIVGETQSYGAGNYDSWVLKLDTNGSPDSDCSIIGDTAVMPVNTGVIPLESLAVATNSSDSLQISTASPQNSDAAMGTQCCDGGPFEINIYGASAQFQYWEIAAPEFLRAISTNGGMGCSDADVYAASNDFQRNNGLHDRDAGIAVCAGAEAYAGVTGAGANGNGETVIVRYTTQRSYDAVMAVQDSNAFIASSDAAACHDPGDRLMAAPVTGELGPLGAPGNSIAALECMDVHVGASDVSAKTFKQTSDGWARGPMGDNSDIINRMVSYPVTVSSDPYDIGFKKHTPFSIPFGFLANNDPTTPVPVNNLSNLTAVNVFTGQYPNWNDLDPSYPNLPMIVCHRHAGSGNAAAFNAIVLRGNASMPITQQDGDRNSDYYSRAVDRNHAPAIYFNKTSSLSAKCAGQYLGAISYADSDKCVNGCSGDYGNVKAIAYEGIGGDFNNDIMSDAVNYGRHIFWESQHLYCDECGNRDELIDALADYASKSTNMISEKTEFWAADDCMRWIKASGFAWPSYRGPLTSCP